MKNFMGLSLLGIGLDASVAVSAATIVPGSANPNLAGRAGGYACCSGDSVPGEVAVLVNGLSFASGDRLAFSVTGSSSVGPGTSTGLNPGASDGSAPFSMTN